MCSHLEDVNCLTGKISHLLYRRLLLNVHYKRKKDLWMNNNSLIAVWKIIPAKHLIRQNKGIKGWRSGESGRLPPMWPWFKSGRRRHLWVEFVGGSLPCSERFFSSYSGFPLSSKTNFSKFQFAQESGRQRTTLRMCYLQIITIILLTLQKTASYLYEVPLTKSTT